MVHPDGAEQRIVHGVPFALDQPEAFEPTPWEIYTYDRGDNAGRTHFGSADEDASHWNTPLSVEVDALERVTRSVSRLGASPGDEVVSHSTYDLRGNPLALTDPLGRTAFQHEYDLADRPIRSASLDAGVGRAVYDALGRGVERRDAKGALQLASYDPAGRPDRVWARDDATVTVTLRQRLEYGDAGDPAQDPTERQAQRALNRLGKATRHFDEAGLVTFDAYDFKGNVVDRARRVFSDDALLAPFDPPPAGWEVDAFIVDWQSSATEAMLEAGEHRFTESYDAVGRLRSMLYPEDIDGERKELRPHYDRAGYLESVEVDGQPFAQRIAYNARGQRILVAYGNGVMTRHAYDPQTFRLARLRSEAFSLTGEVTYQPIGPALQDFGYRYDRAGNVVAIQDRTPGSGVPNTVLGQDALDRLFTYDPLYRLLSATGREQAVAPAASPWDDAVRSQDPTLTRAYTESYLHDVAGNLLTLQHQATGGAYTRQYSLVPGTGPADGNRLYRFSVGQIEVDYLHDAAGNLLREATSRHFEWDDSDRLRVYRTQTTGAEPSVYARYLYDAAGQRVKKLVRQQGGGYEATTYVDGLFEHHRSVQGSTAQENNTLHVMDDSSRVAALRVGPPFPGDASPAVQYHLGDHLGSSQLVIDDTGAWVRREEHTPYGETSFGGFARKRYRYTGKERDGESGLYYYGARYFAPWLARWCSTDPAGNVDGPNLYAYVRSNPIRLIDRDGRDSGAGGGDGSYADGDPDGEYKLSGKPPKRVVLMKAILKVIKQLRASGMTTKVLQEVSRWFYFTDDDGTSFMNEDERRINFTKDVFSDLEKVTQGGQFVYKAVETMYHEFTHGYLYSKKHEKKIAEFVKDIKIHYKGSRVKSQNSDRSVTTSDPKRLGMEAAAEYVGWKARTWWSTRLELERMKPGSSVDGLAKRYDTAMKKDVFGYSPEPDGAGKTEQMKTSRKITSKMRKFLDEEILGGQIGDSFDKDPVFKKIIAEKRLKRTAP